MYVVALSIITFISNHSQIPVPWECRDKEDQARAAYYHPLRQSNQILTEENLKLKRLLSENGISWSPLAATYLARANPGKRRTRSTVPKPTTRTVLPMEIMLRILQFAMQSKFPIIDPLSPSNRATMTGTEITRPNQIAIHFLATCTAMHKEGTRLLWENNEFIFTSPEALYNFAELDAKYRNRVQHITCRIVARYYDDQRRRHRLERSYHPDLKKDQKLHVRMRPKESPLVRGGFRCYTWHQVVDFLAALQAPYDPAFKDKTNPRPKLFPSLTSLRLDLVNFSEALIPFTSPELHHMASHELGCTLNELQITGMPMDEIGMKAAAELCGMLKDEGLFLDGAASFVALSKNLQPMSGRGWCARVIRAWEDDDLEDEELYDDHEEHLGWHRPKLGLLPPAPAESGHPPSSLAEDKVIWKKVPLNRDDVKRHWMEFSRYSGYETDPVDSDDGTPCSCCGDIHLSPDSLFSDDDYM